MIYFSDFSVPAAGGGNVGTVIPFSVNSTDTSATDATYFDGATPEAVLLLGSPHIAGNDGSATSQMGWSMGLVQPFDGSSTDYMAWAASEDSQTSSDTYRLAWDYALNVGNRNASTRSVDAALVANGFTLTHSETGDYPCAAMAFGGDGTDQIASGAVDLGSSAGTISVSCGFEPDLVLVVANGANIGTGFASFMTLMFGAAVNDGSDTQRSVFWIEQDAQAAGAPQQTISTAHAIMQLDAASGGLAYAGVISFTATGFDIDMSASSGGDDAIYIAIKLNGATAKIVDFETPTATGADTVTVSGMTPSLAILVGTMLEAVDSYGNATDETQEGLGISFLSANEQIAGSWLIESGADPTHTTSRIDDDTALMVDDNTGSAAIKATLTSFASGQMNLNYSSVKGTAKKCWGLFVG